MARKKVSETVTENLFRDFYGANTFIEKSAIPSGYGFTSKKVRLIVAILIFSVIAETAALWLKPRRRTTQQHKTKSSIT